MTGSAKQSIPSCRGKAGCFVASLLAMTVLRCRRGQLLDRLPASAIARKKGPSGRDHPRRDPSTIRATWGALPAAASRDAAQDLAFPERDRVAGVVDADDQSSPVSWSWPHVRRNWKSEPCPARTSLQDHTGCTHLSRLSVKYALSGPWQSSEDQDPSGAAGFPSESGNECTSERPVETHPHGALTGRTADDDTLSS